MRSRAIVVVSPALPRLDSGGPVGACYRLLLALSRAPDLGAELYCLCTSRPALYRVAGPEDLHVFNATRGGSAYVTQLRERLIRTGAYSRARGVRDGFQVAVALKELLRLARLGRLLEDFIAAHSAALFHAHSVKDISRLVHALGGENVHEAKLLLTDHSKGGEGRQYLQLLGKGSSGDWAFAALARRQESAIKIADVVAFPSRGAQMLWEECNPNLAPLISAKTAVLYNGVPRPRIASQPAKGGAELRLLAVAEHIHDKGLDRLMIGMREVRRSLPDQRVSLRIAGSATPFTGGLVQMRGELGLDTQVQFLGKVSHDNLMRELADADVLVAMPRVVVFDLSILEAMSMGKPIVTTELPGNVEALGSGYPMFAREENEFAQKVAELVKIPRLRDSVGRSNYQRYEALFTSEAMASQHLKLYESLLALRESVRPQEAVR